MARLMVDWTVEMMDTPTVAKKVAYLVENLVETKAWKSVDSMDEM